MTTQSRAASTALDRLVEDLWPDWDAWSRELQVEVVTGFYMGMRAALVNPVYAATLATLFAEETESSWTAMHELAMRALINQHPITEAER